MGSELPPDFNEKLPNNQPFHAVSRLLPEILELVRGHFGVPNSVHDISVAHVALQGSGVMPIVGEFIAGGVPEHVRMNGEWEFRLRAESLGTLCRNDHGRPMTSRRFRRSRPLHRALEMKARPHPQRHPHLPFPPRSQEVGRLFSDHNNCRVRDAALRVRGHKRPSMWRLPAQPSEQLSVGECH